MRKQKAVALILAYTVSATLIVLAAATAQKAHAEYNFALRNHLKEHSLYVAEGAIEDVVNDIVNDIANYVSEPTVIGQWASYTGSNGDFISSGCAVSYETYALDDVDTTEVDSTGVTTFIRTYHVKVVSTDNQYNDIFTTVEQIFQRKKTFTFQHAVFYEDDLEMLPGPDMTLSGKIHSNTDIYLGTHNTFTINSEYLKTAGDFYNYRKNDGSTLGGDVRIRINGSSPVAYDLVLNASDVNPLDSDRADWMAESQTRWAGTVQSGVHGVTRLATPSVGSIQPGDYYDSNANVRVENGVIKKGGVALVEGVDIPVGTVTTTTFTNNREGKTARVVDIDMRKLAGYNPSDPDGSPTFSNNFPANGLLYATRNDQLATEVPGVRLVNGSKIYNNAGLTVVSNVPLYIKGDYNNVEKKPTSVITDSVNILSNSWDDTKSSQILSNRTATDTEVNTAFIAGIKETPAGGGTYSGGLENYPRLHEDWGGDELKIRGSFVELWQSSVAQGDWVYGGNQYKAPIRNWDYDTDFNNASNLPPFTPFAVEAEKVVWWSS